MNDVMHGEEKLAAILSHPAIAKLRSSLASREMTTLSLSPSLSAIAGFPARRTWSSIAPCRTDWSNGCVSRAQNR